MKRLAAILLFCGWSLCSTAQANKTSTYFYGRVLFFSSNKSPAVKVQISDAQYSANNVRTLTSGEFVLEYPVKVKPPGSNIQLAVDTVNTRYGLLEIVNKEVLTTVPPINQSAPLEIIVCPKGQRNVIAARYYHVIQNSNNEELARKQHEFDQLSLQQIKDYRKIAELSAMIGRLQMENDSVKIYKEAYHFANINKDFASANVVKYLNLLDQGKSIQVAREALDKDEAAAELTEGYIEKNAGLTKIKNAIEVLAIRADASYSIFDYGDAIGCLNTIIKISETNGASEKELAGWYAKIGNILSDNGDYNGAAENEQKALTMSEKFLSENSDKLAIIISDLALIYQHQHKYDDALRLQKRDLAIREHYQDTAVIAMGISCDNIAVTYTNKNDYASALTYETRAITLRLRVRDTFGLAHSYNNLSSVYHGLHQIDTALKYEKKSLALFLTLPDEGHGYLATIYANLAKLSNDLQQYQEGLDYAQKAIRINEAMMSKNPSLRRLNIGYAYRFMADSYRGLRKYPQGLEVEKKSLAIYESILDKTDPRLAELYSDLSLSYGTRLDFENALIYQTKAVAILETHGNESYADDLGDGYMKVAVLYNFSKNYPQALAFVDKAKLFARAHTPGMDDLYRDVEKFELEVKTNFGDSLMSAKNYRQAITYYQFVLAKHKTQTLLNEIGLCYYFVKDYPSAIFYYKQVPALDSLEKFSINNNIGIAYAKNGQLTEAAKAFTAFENEHRDTSRVYRDWAMYYGLKKQKELALANLQKAIDNGFSDTDWLCNDESMAVLKNDKRYQKLVNDLQRKIIAARDQK